MKIQFRIVKHILIKRILAEIRGLRYCQKMEELYNVDILHKNYFNEFNRLRYRLVSTWIAFDPRYSSKILEHIKKNEAKIKYQSKKNSIE